MLYNVLKFHVKGEDLHGKVSFMLYNVLKFHVKGEDLHGKVSLDF
jgi:hypothetical protein